MSTIQDFNTPFDDLLQSISASLIPPEYSEVVNTPATPNSLSMSSSSNEAAAVANDKVKKAAEEEDPEDPDKTKKQPEPTTMASDSIEPRRRKHHHRLLISSLPPSTGYIFQTGKTQAIVVCWFLGIGFLVTWNSVLTVSYYYYKLFPDYHFSRVVTVLYFSIALVTNATLVYNEATLNTRKRNIFGYTLYFLGTLGLLLVDLASRGKGGIGNYIAICVIIAALGVADAHVQGGLVGDLSFMCPDFMQSFFAGAAAAGALTAALRLITEAAFDKTHDGLRKGFILFIAIATLFEFICIFLYAYVFVKLPIVKYYRSKAASEGSMTVSSDLAAAGIHTNANDKVGEFERLSTKELLFQNWDYALDLFCIYVITLSIFPGFLYENTGTHHKLGSWYSLVLVAMYNAWDFIARYIPLIECIRLKSRKGTTFLTFLRVLLIPCFYYTAKYADQGYMIFLVSFLGLRLPHCLHTQTSYTRLQCTGAERIG